MLQSGGKAACVSCVDKKDAHQYRILTAKFRKNCTFFQNEIDHNFYNSPHFCNCIFYLY